MTKPGFLIGGRLFPFPDAFTLGDAPLVEAQTRLKFEDWAERVEAMGPDEKHPDREPRADVTALGGMLAVAVSRAEPGWSIDRIIRFLREDVDFESLDFEAGETADPPAEPAETPEESPSPWPQPSDASTISADDSPGGVPV